MAYKRTETYDGVTKMNKALYDNLQDGIDESIGTICNIAGADKYNENKIYKNGDKCIINNKIYSKKGDMADDTVLPYQFDISEWEEISIMSDIMIQMSAMQSSIEAIINGLEEKFGDGGLYMKNWRIEVNESSVLINSNYEVIAPADNFLLFYHTWTSGSFPIPTLTSDASEFSYECVMNFTNNFVLQGYTYPIYAIFYSISCKKGDKIIIHPQIGGDKRPMSIVSIY